MVDILYSFYNIDNGWTGKKYKLKWEKITVYIIKSVTDQTKNKEICNLNKKIYYINYRIKFFILFIQNYLFEVNEI